MCTAGSIRWLPAKADIPPRYSTDLEGIEYGCFNHPVLVLSVSPSKDQAIILIITSFGGMDLAERHPKRGHPSNIRIRSEYIPIHPSKVHPDNGSLIYLSKRSRLSKKSYLHTTPQRTVKTAVLRPARDPTCRLKRKSLKEVTEFIGFKAPWGALNSIPQPADILPPVLGPIPQPACRLPPARPALPEPLRYVSAPPSNAWHADYSTYAQRSCYISQPDRNTFYFGERSPLLPPNDGVGASLPREEPPWYWKGIVVALVCIPAAVCLYRSGILGSIWGALRAGLGLEG